MGLAVGDALGGTTEFCSAEALPFDGSVRGPHREVIGGGVHHLRPGQVTDDTQMAICLARGLKGASGFNVQQVARRYVRWARLAFDVGIQTSSVLARISGGVLPEDASRAVWVSRTPPPAGNGSLMRTVPIALFYHRDDEQRCAVSLDDAGITHFDPRCRLSCTSFNTAIARALDGSASPKDMLQAARAGLEQGHRALLERYPDLRRDIDNARTDLGADLAAAEDSDPDLYGRQVSILRFSGFVRVAFRLAFWHLLHTDSYEAALVDVVNRGGDADTNGAIAGALLGARFGVNGIPARWRDMVVGALDGEKGPWATEYHPRFLFSLFPGSHG